MFRHVFALMFAVLAGSASATTLSGAMTVDDRFRAFLSTDDLLAGNEIVSGAPWETTTQFSLGLEQGKNYYLHVFGEDVGGAISGFLGSFSLSDTGFSFANGAQSLNTNTTDWRVSKTGFGVDYAAPVSHGQNGVSPWGNRYPAISPDAEWIWTGRADLGSAYFSTMIVSNVSPVPEPMTALLMASGLGIVVLRRRREAAVA